MEPQEIRGIGARCSVGHSDRSKNVSSTLHQPHPSGGLREKPSSVFRGLIAGPIQSVAELPLVALITVNIGCFFGPIAKLAGWFFLRLAAETAFPGENLETSAASACRWRRPVR